MKIRAIATGEIRDESDEAAKELIAAGIYEAVVEPSTSVAPLTTMSAAPLTPEKSPNFARRPQGKKGRR